MNFARREPLGRTIIFIKRWSTATPLADIDHDGNVVFNIYYSLSWKDDVEIEKRLSLEEVIELHDWLGKYLKEKG